MALPNTLKHQLNRYTPRTEQEQADISIIYHLIDLYPHNLLDRSNQIAHFTSSAFILNPSRTKTLFVHHNLYNHWTWTGGHADGNSNLLEVALKEAFEETGVSPRPLMNGIAGVDILPVAGHFKKGYYIPSHLHLSIAYLFEADDTTPLQVCEAENSDIKWFDLSKITLTNFETHDYALYQKLISVARNLHTKGVND